MEKNKQAKQGGSSAFFWGLVIGALLATLLTTKNGRKILHELVDIILSMMEDFTEKKASKMPVVTQVRNTVNEVKTNIQKEAEFEKIVEEIDSEIAEYEQPTKSYNQKESTSPVQVMTEEEVIVEDSENTPVKSNGNSKKRLFHGIRKSK